MGVRGLAASAAIAALLSACGSGGDDNAATGLTATTRGNAVETTTAAPTTAASTTTDAPGGILEPGNLPPPWIEANGSPISVASLAQPGAAASAVSCPSGIEAAPGTSTQCTAYADEGGPYVGIDVKTPGAAERVTLYCQVDQAKRFTPSMIIEGRLAAAGPGAADGKGRFFTAVAIEGPGGVHWYAVRRPAGEDCPVVWDLGVDDGTLAAVSTVGGATYPLVDGPSCTRLAPEGLLVKPGSADGACT